MLPLGVEGVGRRTDCAIEIEQLLVGPYFGAVTRRRKGQVAAQPDAARSGVSVNLGPLAMRQVLPVHVLVDRRREFGSRAIERAGFAPAQLVGPSLPRREIVTIFERAEQRIVVEPFAMARGERVYRGTLAPVRGEMVERGL